MQSHRETKATIAYDRRGQFKDLINCFDAEVREDVN